MFFLTLLCACPPTVSTDTGDVDADTADTVDTADTSDTADTGASGPTTAVVTTVSDDYASAVLATVDLATWSITDSVTTIGSDNAIGSADGQTWILDRYAAAVRIYDNGSWAAPAHEFSTGDGSNPQGVATCGGKLWVPTYGDAMLRSYDPSTFVLNGSVDLSAYADSDGIPETADVIVRGDELYVALQQLDEANGWIANGGKLVKVDCATGTVVQAWDAVSDPSLHDWPGHEGFLIRTGVYYNADYSLALDGGIALFDPSNGVGGPMLAETTLNANITDLTMVDDRHGIVLTQDETSAYTAWCWDLNTSATVELFTTTSYLQAVEAAPDGQAWIVARQSWTDPSSEGGIITVDAVSCQAGTEVWHKDFGFSPYAVAFY